ncbi:MAG: hypothetical protein RhofKO_18730 [Rhodothermales bacterium]
MPQHIEYGRSERVADSPYFLSPVYVVDRELSPEVQRAIESAGDVSMNLIGARVNALVFSEDRTEVTTLIDGFGYINYIGNPMVVQRDLSPSAQAYEYLLFEIALTDTNGDQRINAEDRMAYFLSDYSGRNLRQITPDSLTVERHWFSADDRGIFFETLTVGPEEEIYGVTYTRDVRKVYHYDLETEQFEAFDALQAAFEDMVAAYRTGSTL